MSYEPEVWAPLLRRLAVNFGLMVVAFGLYIAPMAICADPDLSGAVCDPSAFQSAAVVFKIASLPFFFAAVLCCFYSPAPWGDRIRISFWAALATVPAASFMHIPNFISPGMRDGENVVQTRLFYLFLLILLFVWAKLRRPISEWEALWRRLDPNRRISYADRRRAIFWHPAAALFVHEFVAISSIWRW